MAGTIRLGIGGWVYEPWRKTFYPEGLKQKDELAYASARLGNIEVNSTFYSNQRATSFQNWASQAPDGFIFSIKGHQLITHIKRLKDVELPLANVFASGVMALGAKLGPFCWQLPPNLSYDEERLEAFLSLLPHTPQALVELAKKTDYAKSPPFIDATGITRVRHAMEVRHKTFADPRFIDQLRRHNVALVVADTEGWPYIDQTADFSYARLQGPPGKESYSTDERDIRASWIKAWSEGSPAEGGPYIATPEANPPQRDVHAFFISTDKVHAPDNARAVMAGFGLKAPGAG